MKRKTIISLLTACLMMSGTAMASSPSVVTEDVSRDIIRISGEATPGNRVTILVLNPGYTYADYTGENRAVRNKAVQYLGFTEAGADGYSLSFRVTGENGGAFTVYAAGEEETFEYYNKNYKEKFFEEFNKGGEADETELMRIIGLIQHPLYTGGDISSIKKAVKNLLPLEADAAKSYGRVYDALLLSAFNTHNSELLIKDGQLLYASDLGISDTDEYEDYLNSLSSKGRKAINDALTGGTYTTKQEIKDKFLELLYVNLIMNYTESGYGHVQTVFEKYSEQYKAAGVNFPSKADRALYQQLLGSGAGSLSAIGKVLSGTGSKTQSGGLGAPRNTSSGTGSTSYVNPQQLEAPVDEKPVPSFKDLNNGHWAYAAVISLAADEVIAGYENGDFKPDGLVTRAEFTKMLAVLLKLTGGNADFSDVSSSDWFAPYVRAAAARDIILGADGRFNPSTQITRQDAAVIIARAAKLTGASTADFTDNADIAEYARAAVGALSQKGIISGFEDGSFAPLQPLTRAQAAVMLSKLAQEGVTE